ncbi:hypothetical protein HaLaN_29152 [Haematococcus lacustris]|uniref:Uncharacterized protein n=1 Tax=Haematococcus lacustris TaxID=44745 RepID=A0A6A0ABS6_HAELA|nr:hypothetical protein HaLaN_29152 [Haematococcus lacustris]
MHQQLNPDPKARFALIYFHTTVYFHGKPKLLEKATARRTAHRVMAKKKHKKDPELILQGPRGRSSAMSAPVSQSGGLGGRGQGTPPTGRWCRYNAGAWPGHRSIPEPPTPSSLHYTRFIPGGSGGVGGRGQALTSKEGLRGLHGHVFELRGIAGNKCDVWENSESGVANHRVLEFSLTRSAAAQLPHVMLASTSLIVRIGPVRRHGWPCPGLGGQPPVARRVATNVALPKLPGPNVKAMASSIMHLGTHVPAAVSQITLAVARFYLLKRLKGSSWHPTSAPLQSTNSNSSFLPDLPDQATGQDLHMTEAAVRDRVISAEARSSLNCSQDRVRRDRATACWGAAMPQAKSVGQV